MRQRCLAVVRANGGHTRFNLFRRFELIDSKFSLLALLGNVLKQGILIFVSELLMKFSLSHNKIVLKIIL